jgi:Tfp pilus assembly protein PilO
VAGRSRQRKIRRLGSALHCGGALVSLALLALGAWVVVAPLRAERSKHLQRCAHLDRLIAGRAGVEREHARLSQELQDVRRRKEEIRRRITDSAQVGEFLRQVSQVADDVGVRLREFRPGAATRTGQYGVVRIELHCTGGYRGICEFLERLDKLPRLATIDRLDIAAPNRGESYTFKISLDIYFAARDLAAQGAEQEGDDV